MADRDIASLGIEVDSTDVKNASGELVNLGKAASGTQSKVKSFKTEWSDLIGKLPVGVTVAGAVAAAIGGIGIKAFKAAEDARQAQARLEIVYANSGKNIGRTLDEINSKISEISDTSIFDSSDITRGATEIAKFGNITGETFDLALKAAADYATFIKTDFQTAAGSIAGALTNPIQAYGLLKEAGEALTGTQKDYIKVLVDSGQESKAQAILAQTLANAYEGSQEKINGVGAEFAKVSNEIGEAFEAIGRTPPIDKIKQGAIDAARTLLGLLKDINAVLNTFGSSIDSQISSAQRKLANLKASPIAGFLSDLSGGRAAIEKQLANLQLNKKFLEQGSPTQAPKDKSAFAPEDELKKEIDRLKEELKGQNGTRTNQPRVTGPSIPKIDPILAQYKSLEESLKRQAALYGDNTELSRILYDTQNGALSKLDSRLKENLKSQAKELDLVKERAKAYEEYDAIIEEGQNLARKQREDTEAEIKSLDQQFNEPLRRFEEQLGRIRDALSFGIIDSARAKEEFDIIGKAYNDSFIDPAKQGTDELSAFSRKAAENIHDNFADFLFDPFQKGLDGMAIGFLNFLRRAAAEAASAQILSSLTGGKGSGIFSSIIGGLFSGAAGAVVGGGGGIVAGGGNLSGQIGSFFGGARANGGPVDSGKTYLVGERGPELFSPGNSGSITPNNAIGGSTINNITIQVQSSPGDSPADTGNKVAEAFIRAISREEIATANRPGNALNKVTSFS